MAPEKHLRVCFHNGHAGSVSHQHLENIGMQLHSEMGKDTTDPLLQPLPSHQDSDALGEEMP